MTADELARAHALMMSPTMGLLGNLARGMPVDVTDKDAVRAALATTSAAMIDALDGGRIHFDTAEDRAMLYGLLCVVMEVMFDGQFAANLVKSAGMQ